MPKNGRVVEINGIEIVIKDANWTDSLDDENSDSKIFSVSFQVHLTDKQFWIQFDTTLNDDKQKSHAGMRFKGVGAAYDEFIKALETSTESLVKNQHAKETEALVNDKLGKIAKSIYDDVQSHSPDQDED